MHFHHSSRKSTYLWPLLCEGVHMDRAHPVIIDFMGALPMIAAVNSLLLPMNPNSSRVIGWAYPLVWRLFDRKWVFFHLAHKPIRASTPLWHSGSSVKRRPHSSR